MSTARYGDGAVYGAAGLTYGEAAVSRPVTWLFEVDWDGDDVFDGYNEGGNMRHMETENGRQFFVQGNGEGFEPVMTGNGTIHLLNTSGRYDPFNIGGPLEGQILPGRKFRLRVQRESDGQREPVMTGRIKDIRPLYGDLDMVKVELVNEAEELKKKKVHTTVQSTIRFDDAFQAVLDAFGWTGNTDIDTTVSEAMEYWWAGGASAFAELQAIAEAALGMFCIAEDGSPTFKSRISSETPLMTITDDDVLREYPIKTPMPWETIFNRIRVYARKRNLQSSITLWQASDKPLVPAGESREIWADFSYNNEEAVATSVTTPVENTDYDANSQEDGGGSDLSGNIAITLTPFARTAKEVVSNNGGSDAYLTILKLRGDAIVADKYTFVERIDEESIEAFGDRELIVKTDWLQDINTATDQADILLSRLANQRQYPRFKMYDQFDLQFGTRVFGLMQTNFASKGITGEFRFGYIRHRWVDDLGYKVETEIYLEPNLLGNVSGTWVFPAVFGVTTVF